MVHEHEGAPGAAAEGAAPDGTPEHGLLTARAEALDAHAVLLYAVRAACSKGWSPLAPATWLADRVGPDPETVRTALEYLQEQATNQPDRWRTRAIATLTVALADLETRGAGREGAVGTATQRGLMSAEEPPSRYAPDGGVKAAFRSNPSTSRSTWG